MKPILFFMLIISTSFLSLPIMAKDIGLMETFLQADKRYQVAENKKSYYIQTSSYFHDAQARRSLALLSKVALLRHIQKSDPKVTSLDLKGFQIQKYYEKNGLLYAVSSIDKSQVKFGYNLLVKKQDQNKPIKDEISRLETVKPKTKEVHAQLKELYFILGDIDNYNKQSDIIMEMMFDEI